MTTECDARVASQQHKQTWKCRKKTVDIVGRTIGRTVVNLGYIS